MAQQLHGADEQEAPTHFFPGKWLVDDHGLEPSLGTAKGRRMRGIMTRLGSGKTAHRPVQPRQPEGTGRPGLRLSPPSTPSSSPRQSTRSGGSTRLGGSMEGVRGLPRLHTLSRRLWRSVASLRLGGPHRSPLQAQMAPFRSMPALDVFREELSSWSGLDEETWRDGQYEEIDANEAEPGLEPGTDAAEPPMSDTHRAILSSDQHLVSTFGALEPAAGRRQPHKGRGRGRGRGRWRRKAKVQLLGARQGVFGSSSTEDCIDVNILPEDDASRAIRCGQTVGNPLFGLHDADRAHSDSSGPEVEAEVEAELEVDAPEAVLSQPSFALPGSATATDALLVLDIEPVYLEPRAVLPTKSAVRQRPCLETLFSSTG